MFELARFEQAFLPWPERRALCARVHGELEALR